MKITARYRFKHRIYHISKFKSAFQAEVSTRIEYTIPHRLGWQLSLLAQWVKVLGLFVPMQRAWEGPSSNPEPTALFFLFSSTSVSYSNDVASVVVR
jgi:hypothetical protein